MISDRERRARAKREAHKVFKPVKTKEAMTDHAKHKKHPMITESA